MILLLFTACENFLGTGAVTPTRGVWENNVFTSEYLGLSFTIPSSWEAATEAEMLLMAANMFTLEGDSLQLMGGDDDVFYDMVATNHFTGAGVEIYFMRHGGLRPPTMAEAIDSLVELNEQMGGNVNYVSSGTVRIGEHDWGFVDAEMRMFGFTTFDRHFVIVRDGFICNIRIIYNDESELREVIQSMFGDLSGLPPAERPQELVGTWLWDEGISYKLIFHADGRGARGFDWEDLELEEFGWRIYDSEHLLIYTEFMIESFTYSISEGIITLDSLQFDERFSYLSEALLERAEELIGVWAWDEDNTFTYTFQGDGEGVRGFNLEEGFDWRTEGGELLLIYSWWGDVESWTYTIAGDVLTLENLQSPDIIHSYIRQ